MDIYQSASLFLIQFKPMQPMERNLQPHIHAYTNAFADTHIHVEDDHIRISLHIHFQLFGAPLRTTPHLLPRENLITSYRYGAMTSHNYQEYIGKIQAFNIPQHHISTKSDIHSECCRMKRGNNPFVEANQPFITLRNFY